MKTIQTVLILVVVLAPTLLAAKRQPVPQPYVSIQATADEVTSAMLAELMPNGYTVETSNTHVLMASRQMKGMAGVMGQLVNEDVYGTAPRQVLIFNMNSFDGKTIVTGSMEAHSQKYGGVSRTPLDGDRQRRELTEFLMRVKSRAEASHHN